MTSNWRAMVLLCNTLTEGVPVNSLRPHNGLSELDKDSKAEELCTNCTSTHMHGHYRNYGRETQFHAKKHLHKFSWHKALFRLGSISLLKLAFPQERTWFSHRKIPIWNKQVWKDFPNPLPPKVQHKHLLTSIISWVGFISWANWGCHFHL